MVGNRGPKKTLCYLDSKKDTPVSHIANGTKYSRMDQVNFVKDSL